MRVLIAEDDVTSRRILESTLAKCGYEVTAVRDGAEAWRAMQADNPPLLVVLDWIMPEMDGVEVCRNIRAHIPMHERYVYIILLTSKGSKEEVVVGIEAGADDYMVKPFHPQELRVRIRAGQRIVELHSELVSAKEALKIQATLDTLTGLLNHGAILERLKMELSRARRERRSLGVAMIDIDHFKRVNDSLGHLTGDGVLRECAKRILSTVRDYDSVGRYGGEEFLIILPGVQEVEAKNVLERVRMAVGEREMVLADKAIRVTVSSGVVSSDGSGNADEVIQAADAALYQAKKLGRNRVECSKDNE
ncbi:MAG: diguanylate cyclase [Deltaproteobacteria bacterium]|nr:diguanylate cyclase [Deltaproteobacteria bacterium]